MTTYEVIGFKNNLWSYDVFKTSYNDPTHLENFVRRNFGYTVITSINKLSDWEKARY